MCQGSILIVAQTSFSMHLTFAPLITDAGAGLKLNLPACNVYRTLSRCGIPPFGGHFLHWENLSLICPTSPPALFRPTQDAANMGICYHFFRACAQNDFCHLKSVYILGFACLQLLHKCRLFCTDAYFFPSMQNPFL